MGAVMVVEVQPLCKRVGASVRASPEVWRTHYQEFPCASPLLDTAGTGAMRSLTSSPSTRVKSGVAVRSAEHEVAVDAGSCASSSRRIVPRHRRSRLRPPCGTAVGQHHDDRTVHREAMTARVESRQPIRLPLARRHRPHR